jgi:branched-chain amino acid transport system permease protein
VIGPNGAGKTTFFKMLTWEVAPTSGTIRFEGRDRRRTNRR